ncbi:piezo-type mechanosensitive ion channel component isoform X3 [Plodia interpunctella]|uniref:piezo-type mechanosensitive ion channel component isoform X3 n=1 Tax=Plodia interpunctella TaxID=58824 RepID=UPI002367E793|nr:piezo-type mechanosensitive ion channel component isoform X3 [Plodia interpunctella]
MAANYCTILMVRVVLPVGLLLSIALRPFGLSLIYLLLYLLAPLIQVFNNDNSKLACRRLLHLNIVVSITLLLTHAAWHGVLVMFPPYGSLLETYPLMQRIGHNLGLVGYNTIKPWMAVHYLAPELLMTVTSVVVYMVVQKVTVLTSEGLVRKDMNYQRYPMLTSAGKYLCLILIMFSGILRPNVVSGIYFLVFMGAATAWSLGQPLNRGFAIAGRFVMFVMALNIITLLVYQCNWIIEMFPPNMGIARYFGLTQVVAIIDTDPHNFSFIVKYDQKWMQLASPIVILFTYCILAIETRELLKPKTKRRHTMTGLELGKQNGSVLHGFSGEGYRANRDKWMMATKKIRLMNRAHSGTGRRWSGVRSRHFRQDSTGSVVVGTLGDDTMTDIEESSVVDEIIAAVIDFFQIVVRSSYIATTITMMAWSIMFHSWLTFVFLMWANIVWLRQDQRSFMLKTSPVLVLYAMSLLILQYVYGMNLTELELPSSVPEVNLRQIGVMRPEGEPCVPILIKTLFTCMFWVTLRQRVQEIRQKRQSIVATDLAAPLQLTVSTGASAIEEQRDTEYQSRLLRVLGVSFRRFCARYWIYVVVIMLFVIGITGDRMTIFRIIYMFLFLVFILMFQISWYYWRRLMYVFWITLIMYSMLNLILIYIYQFDNFSKTIETYLMINEKLQHDLGLDTYDPADLFVKLLTPTLFLIITIMQVHYFHKDFMELSDPKTQTNSVARDIESNRQSPGPGGSTMRDDDLPPLPIEEEPQLSREPNVRWNQQTTVMAAINEDPNARSTPDPNVPTTSDPNARTEQRSNSPNTTDNKDQNVRIKAQDPKTMNTQNLNIRAADNSNAVKTSDTDDSHSLGVSSAYSRTQRSNRNTSHGYQNSDLMRGTAAFHKWLCSNYRQIRHKVYAFMDKLFLYLHLHLVKIVFFALMLLCVCNVCAMHMPIMVIISPALWLSAKKQRFCLLFLSTLISIYLMALMVYQIDYIQSSFFDVNCTFLDANGTAVSSTYSNANWVGFHKTSKHKPLVTLVKGYIGIICTFTFYSLLTYRHQSKGEIGSTRVRELIYPKITRKEADIDLLHCFKYVVNYGFYKFGVEVTLMALIAVIGSRMDVYAVIYSLWLTILVSLKRPKQARVWPAFCVFVAVVVPFQYALCVGFLPQFCVDYPWRVSNIVSETQMKHIRTWLFLPYLEEPPHALKLVFDYILLLFATRQLIVFRTEKKYGDSYPGGSNDENIGQDWETAHFVNPVPDFLGFVGSWLDVLKRMVFLGMLWVTLAIMFMTGTNRVNLFSIGYLIGSFIFLWQGTDFYLRPKEVILLWWSWLLRYNVAVVSVKVLLQIPGCIFSGVLQDHACWLVQLLGIGCVDKFAGGNIAQFIKMQYSKEATCSVPQEDIGLAWDGVCFAFLILQRRLFNSYYFFRVIDESKATTVLASRGAELIEELRQKQMQIQEDQEVKILEKIKVKMERIKANQKKIQGAFIKDLPHHDRAGGRQRYRPPTSHQKAVRSGDYYMFDEFDDTEVPMKGDEESSEDEDAPKEMGIGKLLSTVIKTDVKTAVNMRRASAPAVRSARQQSINSYPSSYPEQGKQVQRQDEDKSIMDDRQRLERERTGPVSELDEFAPEPEPETWFEKVKRLANMSWMFINSLLVSLTRHLMKYSRDYRYVSRTLSVEKKILKEKEGFGIGIREGSQMIWEPLPETIAHQVSARKLSDISVPEIRILAPSMERGLDASPPPHRKDSTSETTRQEIDDDTSEHESAFSLQSSESKDVTTLEEQDDSVFKHEHTPFVYLMYALWYSVVAHTDVVCYIMVFINQIQSATILSIPLPLMVFMWGTLTIPRPTKTFWVTLIAYTEVIVLIKSMFQFEILPWNQNVIPNNMPFTAPRIIGIERKYNYAIYDLLLLLIIFLHRFMLKSLGLWKESTPEIELREDMIYHLTDEDTQNVVEGRTYEVGRKYLQRHNQAGPSPPEAEKSSPAISNAHGQSFRDHSRDEQDTAGPSKPPIGPPLPDDDHYKVNDDKEPIIAVTTVLENNNNHYPQVILLSIQRYMRPTKMFFKRMLAPGARVTADVYAYMFLCDFFNFLVVIFGFAAFGTHQGDGGVQAYLEENKVPIPFLVMLILQFGLIVIDRALYLRKFMMGKILFQYALIVGVHVWMFFVLPFITERTFNALWPPPIWYMLKCVYLLLSAYQIRCGYPRRIIGNFLCKSYRFLNMIFFRGFMAVPFVFELRTLMDWIWTDTSMTLMDWLKMEDIFANVFLLKCSRYVEDEFPQPRGEKKSTVVKYLLGGGVLAFVIAIIWFPLVFFAVGNTVGKPNPPTDVTVKIRIGPYLPVYQMSAQSHNIDVYSQQDYTQLGNLYGRDRTAQTFLSNYMYNDVAVVSINPNSTMTWDISPPELARLENEAMSNATITVKFTFVITHPTNAVPNPPTIEDHREVEMLALEPDGKRNPERETLVQMLQGTAPPNAWLTVKLLFPKFVKVFNKGEAKPAYQLISWDPDIEVVERMYRDVKMRLEREDITNKMYWRVHESCSLRDKLKSVPMNNCDLLVMYTFNDKLFPETLNFISGSGIIGLYTTFVFLASRILRGFFSGIYTKIMFDDLPNVDRVLQLCLDIYLVREALELALEEDLFAKLVFLYRSPETMIKWSRPKEDTEEQRALPPSR